MTWLDPWSLLWLAALAPIVLFFYLLKLRRREQVVSSVLLWSRALRDLQANAPFQRLRKNLLLFLQLLALSLAVLALARPAVYTSGWGGSAAVVVLDGSASMQSRDAGGARFDAAKAAAARMIDRMQPGDRMMLLLAGARPHRLTPLTGDRSELRRALAEARPADTRADLRAALILAISAAKATGSGRVFLLSDGAFEPLDELEARGVELHFLRFGSRAENVGIVAMELRRGLAGAAEGGARRAASDELFVAVRNYGATRRRLNLELYRDTALLDVRPLDLPPARPVPGARAAYSERAEVFENVAGAPGILRARLDGADDMQADDEAYVPVAPPRPVRALLVTAGDLYLEKALLLDPRVRLDVLRPEAYRADPGYDLVIFDGVAPARVGPGAHLYIHCAGPTAPVELRGRIEDAAILDWQRDHPVMRYVSLDQLRAAEALVVGPKPWGVPVAEHQAGPAIVVGEREGVRSAFVGFPILRSEFPLRIAFPIFVQNLVHWLTVPTSGANGSMEETAPRTGQPLPIPVPAGLREIEVVDPEGRRHRVPVEGRLAYFAETERRGLYRAEARGFRSLLAVNFLDREESATAPAERLHLGGETVASGAGRARVPLELWRWLVLLALLVLGVEWWVYHRRP